ncbi:uncharacterized protein F4812DRAFT_419181 [Daldinia caldariorum]|uniref:uncharacterized protein n=1 Tax=Daldinia caldariorum TaxID=326644 RepID=UPI002008212C|nr:uncharacterized protein F4812DRAFT_419181 [Daldinia caldariorum]KAI1470836.1 hypothetical protein F4812DRAFT_419181 [Daldinia caldariorum]
MYVCTYLPKLYRYYTYMYVLYVSTTMSTCILLLRIFVLSFFLVLFCSVSLFYFSRLLGCLRRKLKISGIYVLRFLAVTDRMEQRRA